MAIWFKGSVLDASGIRYLLLLEVRGERRKYGGDFFDDS